MKPYATFDLLIQKTEKGYSARVLASPVGNGAYSEFLSPFSSEELTHLRSVVENPYRDLGRLLPHAESMIEDFGTRLFQRVFQGDLRDCLKGALGATQAKREGLRLQLRLADSELVEWPWEYLYDPSLKLFLARSADTPIVRYADAPHPVPPLPLRLPLRVLVVSAAPRGTSPLAVDEEYGRLEEALGKLVRKRRVLLERLDDATLPLLEARLQQGKYHVLHFIGHGRFNPVDKTGSLAFQDERKNICLVNGSELGDLLSRYELRLVVLNACEGARGASGVSHWLIQRNVSAVVAMQYAVSDRAAVCFASHFYRKIAEGEPVDTALAETRRALLMDRHKAEWGTPVLYMRGEGQVFEVIAGYSRRATALLSAGLIAALGWFGLSYRDLPGERPSKPPPVPSPLPPGDLVCPSPPGLDMNLVYIPEGTFTMGSGRSKRTKAHEVTLSKPICIGRVEVTQRQWKVVFQENPSAIRGDDHPVENVSWHRAKEFLERLNRLDPNAHYRLPSEAQWEYAARAGSSADFSFGDDLSVFDDFGNCDGRDGFEQTAPGGSLKENEWGLYDMYGNVSEWVEDWEGLYGEGPVTDPPGPASGEKRIRRGGGWRTKRDNCNSFHRFSAKPDNVDDMTGFRIVRDPIPVEKQKAAAGPPSLLQLYLP